MGAVMLPERVFRWECPNCTLTAVSKSGRAHSQMHPCRGLQGLIAPMVPAGLKCKVVAVERGDYVRNEQVQADGEGRPIMAVKTVRDDGEDCAVLAPMATAEGLEL